MDPKRVQMLRYPYSLYCRQGDIDHATDHQKLVFALKDAGKQTAVKENLGQWHVDRKNVVAELAGALPATGKRIQIVEKNYMPPPPCPCLAFRSQPGDLPHGRASHAWPRGDSARAPTD